MRGCPFTSPTVQLPLLLAFILTTASTQWDDTNAITEDCKSVSSKNYSSECDFLNSTYTNRLCVTGNWVSTQDWLRNCSFLLEQDHTSEPGESLAAPVLHCKDDREISVTWSETPDDFNPPDDNFIYLLEVQRENDIWRISNVTRRLVGVARNLDPDVSYRFRIQKVGANFRQKSLEGDWIHTFRRWSSDREAETLAPPSRVYKAQPFNFYDNLTASVLIKWEPGKDRTCWYNVIIDNARHDEGLRYIPVHTAETPMEKVISDLKIGVNYSVTVIGLERNHSHSGLKTTDSIPSCEVFPVNLTLTGPSAPNIRSITHDVTQANGENYLVDVTVHWAPIPGGPPSNFTILVQSDLKHYKHVVDGRYVNGTVKNVAVQRSYVVEVFASTPGGEGKHKRSDLIEVTFARATSSTSTIVGCTVVISLIGAAILVRRYYGGSGIDSGKLENSVDQLDLNSIVCYDHWEIPREKLVIGNEIGRGAFGTVHQALLSQPNGVFEVAVKKLRAHPTLEDLKQFRLEMEIMKGVEKHPNVLALVGCVTKLDPGTPCAQLLVVEYCALGDLQSFLRKAWNQMVEQASSDEKGVEYAQLTLPAGKKTLKLVGASEILQIDMKRSFHYRKQRKTQRSFLCQPDSSSASTSGEYSCDAEYENGHLADRPFESQALALSNYTYGLYLGMKGGVPSRDGSGQNLDKDLIVTPADLLSFARQVAMGMDFLSSNRVVHRDLAARNVLVCADRSVKISDFGLSRDIYEQNIYKKVGAEKIPVKWLAIESLMHQIYTTQSDVWSFGILLWEIATLGGSPYPSVSNDSLFRLLSSGYRMERPSTCGTELYKIMCDCWQANPIDRPTFHELKLRLDNLLEAAAPHHYIHIDQLFAVFPKHNASS